MAVQVQFWWIAAMSRPLRIEFAGALYHVMSRGNERGEIVRDDMDRRKRLDWLRRTVEMYGWRFMKSDTRLLRSERFVLRQMEIERGLGDSRSVARDAMETVQTEPVLIGLNGTDLNSAATTRKPSSLWQTIRC